MKAPTTLSTVSLLAMVMVAGAAAPLAAQTCTPAQGRVVVGIKVTLTAKANGKGCAVSKVRPESLVSATPGDVLEWTFENNCDKGKTMKIGKRRPKRPNVGSPNWPTDEDFVLNHKGQNITAEPAPIPSKGTGKVCVVVRPATPRIYKYDIAGDASEDPEVEIQPPPPPPQPK